jgi:hypothetical protein
MNPLTAKNVDTAARGLGIAMAVIVVGNVVILVNPDVEGHRPRKPTYGSRWHSIAGSLSGWDSAGERHDGEDHHGKAVVAWRSRQGVLQGEGGVMVWWVVVGVLMIVTSVWLYRRGLKVYGAIGIVLGIAALLTGYWSDTTIDDTEPDVPVGTVEGVATPEAGEGGV